MKRKKLTICILGAVILTGCESSPRLKEEVRTNYYESGIIKEKYTSIGLHRTVEAYDENGALTQITQYNGDDIRSIKELYPSGNTKKETSYLTPLDFLSMSRGVKDKSTVEYYPNGKPDFKLYETHNGTTTRTSYKQDGEVLIRRRTLSNGKRSGLQYDGLFGWVAQSGVSGSKYSGSNYTGSRLVGYYGKNVAFSASDKEILAVSPYEQGDTIYILITIEEFDENICVPANEEKPIKMWSTEGRPLGASDFSRDINASVTCAGNGEVGIFLAFLISAPSEVVKFYDKMKSSQMFNNTLNMDVSVSGYGVKDENGLFRTKLMRLEIPTTKFVETYDAIKKEMDLKR